MGCAMKNLNPAVKESLTAQSSDHIAASGKPIAEPVKQEPVATDLMDMLRLIETIKYLRGIAERGLGREIRENETIEQFVLGYVKQLESTQPVKQEPVAYCAGFENTHPDGWIDCKIFRDGEFTTPLYAAPVSAPKQEPVAWMSWIDTDQEMNPLHARLSGYEPKAYPKRVPLYAAPVSAKREWVELTDDEVKAALEVHQVSLSVRIGRIAIAAFKEKNK